MRESVMGSNEYKVVDQMIVKCLLSVVVSGSDW